MSKGKRDADEDRWMWFAFVFLGALLGSAFNGQDGAFIGGMLGFALMLQYAVIDAVKDARRKRLAKIEAEMIRREQDAEAAA